MDRNRALRPPTDGPVAATLRRAEELLDADEAQRAVEHLEEAAARRTWQVDDPATSVWLTLGLAHARLRQDRLGSARAAVALAARRVPGGPDGSPSALAFAVSLSAAGLDLAVGDLASAELRLRPIVESGAPGASEAALGLARVAARRGSLHEAERALGALDAEDIGGILQPALDLSLFRAHLALLRGDLERADALLAGAASAPVADAALVRGRLHRARWAKRREARELLLGVRAVEVALSRVRGRSRPIVLREALLHRAVARALAGDAAFAATDARRALEEELTGGAGAFPAAPEWPAGWLLSDAAFVFAAAGDPLLEAAERARDAALRPEEHAAVAQFGAAPTPATGPLGGDPLGGALEAQARGGEGQTSPLVRLALDQGYHVAVRAFRRQVVAAALRETAGHRTRAAEVLGLQRTHLARLIRELEVDVPKRDGRSRHADADDE